MTPNRIINPPIVGVPILVIRSDCGPSARIGWAPALTSTQQIDDVGAEQQHERQRRHASPRRRGT